MSQLPLVKTNMSFNSSDTKISGLKKISTKSDQAPLTCISFSKSVHIHSFRYQDYEDINPYRSA